MNHKKLLDTSIFISLIVISATLLWILFFYIINIYENVKKTETPIPRAERHTITVEDRIYTPGSRIPIVYDECKPQEVAVQITYQIIDENNSVLWPLITFNGYSPEGCYKATDYSVIIPDDFLEYASPGRYQLIILVKYMDENSKHPLVFKTNSFEVGYE